MAGSYRPWLGALALALLLPSLGSAQAPASAAAPTPLTLDEAVARALDRNLDIAVERLNPQTFDLSLAGLRATYRPLLSATFGERSQLNPPSSQSTAASASPTTRSPTTEALAGDSVGRRSCSG